MEENGLKREKTSINEKLWENMEKKSLEWQQNSTKNLREDRK